MPTVQYIHNGETVTKQMPTPKRITSLQHWYKEARKAIPQIPEALIGVFGPHQWCIVESEADIKWVKFDLLSLDNRKAYIVILRN